MFSSGAFACRSSGDEGVGVSHNWGEVTFKDGYKVFFRGSRRLIEFWISENQGSSCGDLLKVWGLGCNPKPPNPVSITNTIMSIISILLSTSLRLSLLTIR